MHMLFEKHSYLSGGDYLQGERKNHWKYLCEQAANEQDPDKLMELVKEINRLLEEKELRLKRGSEANSPS